MKAVEDGLAQLRDEETQQRIVPKMQTRKRLYDLVRYEAYSDFDQDAFSFAASLRE